MPLHAEDEALYDPTPPPDSAFVRVMNAQDQGGPLAAQISNVSVDGVPAPGASPYHVVGQGEHILRIGDQEMDVSIEAGRYYSIALLKDGGGQGLLVLEDELNSNPAKVGIYFYNFSDAASAALTVPDRNAEVVGDVAPGNAGMRKVNAVTVNLAVQVGDQIVKEFPDTVLRRRSSVSVILVGAGKARDAILLENETER